MKACCYARTSTLDQARGEKISIPDQVKWAREYAISRNWEFITEYIEPGVRGDVEFEEREAASQLLRDARSINDQERKFDIVLVYHSSRLAREADLIARFHRILAQDHKIQVYIRNVPIEPVEPQDYYWGGNYMQQVMTSLAGVGDQQENVARSERVRSGFQGLVRNGKLVFAPYGYKKISQIITTQDGKQKYDWHHEIDKQKGEVVKDIYNWYLKGESIRAIQLKLNRDNIPSPSGLVGTRGWSPATIRNILTNPTYTGAIRWGRKLGSKYKQGRGASGKTQRVVIRDNSKLLLNPNGDQPKIIEPAIFNKVQERLTIRGQIHGRAIASDGLLIGVVRCGICGKKCYHKSSHAKMGRTGKPYVRQDYVCQSYLAFGKDACRRYVIAEIKLDNIIVGELGKLVKKAKENKKVFYSGGKNKKDLFQQKFNALNAEVEEQQEAAKKLLRVYTSGKISLELFGEENDRLTKLIADKQVTAKKFADKLNNEEEMKKGQQRFTTLLSDFKNRFGNADLKLKKEIINSLIETITIGKRGEIDIKYRI